MANVPLQAGAGQIKLKYVVRDVDRHGNIRFYVRRPGAKSKIRLREEPGSTAFIAEYQAVLMGRVLATAAPARRRNPPKNESIGWLCLQYYQSAAFKRLDPRTTQKVRRQILDRFCSKEGEKPYKELKAINLRKRLDKMTDRPEAANGLIKALRGLFRFAVKYDLADENPALMVELLRSGSDGHHSWSEEEILAYEKRHSIGTTARLAIALLLYTAQRRSDIVRFGPGHVVNGNLVFTQHKNRNRGPVALTLPILPELQDAIDATPTGTDTFLVTQFGKPFTSNGFGNWFRKRCDEAGLSTRCTAHGLRKAASRRFAESGLTEQELMAWTGHRTSKEVNRYVKAASQSRLAANSLPKIGRPKSPTQLGFAQQWDNAHSNGLI
jgi:integrase